MKKIILILIFFIFKSFLFSFDTFFSTKETRLDFQSDYAYYNQEEEKINLSTNVVIRQYDKNNSLLKTIYSDNLNINLSSSTIIFKENFSIKDSSGLIKGKEGNYDYKTNKGIINNGTFIYDRFIFNAKKIEVNDKNYVYKKATVTTCDKVPPHYHISASRIYLIPQKRFFAYNTFFYLGKIPIFYFPLIYKPLGEGTPILSQFYPGYDSKNGFFIKSNYMYKFNNYTRLKVFLDYFSNKGFGTGTELDYYKPSKNVTSLSYYRIRENVTEVNRWGANGGFWQSLKNKKMKESSDFYLQNYFRLISDPEFNNDFFRSNPFAISEDKQFSIAMTYKGTKATSRISSYSKYLYDNTKKEFYKSYETLPRLDVQTMPMKFFNLPFLNTYNIYAENIKDNTSYYQKRTGLRWDLSQPFNIYKNINFYPTLFYNQDIYFSTSSNNSNNFLSKYGANLNLRYSANFTDLDLNYYVLRRNEINKFVLDKNAIDKGIEEHYLTLSVFSIKSSNSYIRFYSKYDLKDYMTKINFKNRFYPLTIEMYKKTKDLEFFAQENYSITQGNNSFITQINKGNKNNYFHFGLANYDSNKYLYIISNGFGFNPSFMKSWKADLTIRYSFDVKYGYFNFFEKSLVLYKTFHDFRTQFYLRIRPGVNEFFAYITLKMNDPYKNDEINKETNIYFRPWLKENQIR